MSRFLWFSVYNIHNRCSKCSATQAPGASLQGENPDCGGVAAQHYGGVGTIRPASHRQRSGISKSVLVSLQTADILNIYNTFC